MSSKSSKETESFLLSRLEQAVALREKGLFQKAISLIKNTLAHFPENTSLISFLVHCLILQDKIEMAEKIRNTPCN